MQQWIKNTLGSIVFFTLLAGFSRLFDTQTKGFRASNITPVSSFDEQWEPSLPYSANDSLEIQRVLNAPFYFLARGGSSDVFHSEDNQYVIKFFKAHRIHPPAWAYSKIARFLIPYGCEQIINKREAQKKLQFTSYKMAFESLQNQTRVVYLHLNPTTHHKNLITFYDNIGIKHSVSADQTAFVLQKKASSFSLYLKNLLLENNIEGAKLLLSQFASFMKERAIKKIYDGDITPRYNLGMIDHSLMIFDIDQLRLRETELTLLEHMLKDANEMFLWLERKSPELVLFLKEEISLLSNQNE